MILRYLIAAYCLSLSALVQGHTLGIDKGSLVEMAGGSYQLVSVVPGRFQPLIETPQIPPRCSFGSNPRGERGVYEVRFVFSCETPLTADDVIVLPWRREGVMMSVSWQGAEPVTRFVGKQDGLITLALAEFLAGSGTFMRAAQRYTVLGVEHILEGIDHLLFVLALLFVVRSGWKLVQTITAFTVAHSITLGLATLGYINMPAGPVESTIALSIVFLCVEIVHARRGREGVTFTYPWVVAFAFGLLHGLGFAGALSEIGLPPAEIPVALLFFNIGVEIGQLLFVLLVLASMRLMGRLANTPGDSVFLPRAEMILVYGMGTLSAYWLIERLQGMFAGA